MSEVEKAAKFRGNWFRISEVLTIVVCGMLCGLPTLKKIHMWAETEAVREFLLEQFQIRFIPKRAQFYNILKVVDPEKFNLAFVRWVQCILQDDMAGKTVALDGKTICSTDKLTKDGSVLHIISAIMSDSGFVLGSKECGTKMGEKQAFRELLDMLDVAGAIVVADALHCNQKSAEAVINAGGDYLFVVKDNCSATCEDIEKYFEVEGDVEKHTKIEKNGGRIERRTAYVSHDFPPLRSQENWRNLACIGAIHTEFEKDGKKSSEWHYYISSAPLTAENLLKHTRLEWSVESMH